MMNMSSYSAELFRDRRLPPSLYWEAINGSPMMGG